jgi:aminoglycoside phosphotransferase (APT) family kinase protein
MRQPSDDRALYYRQLRSSIHTALVPELTSARAVDTAALIDRILAEFIVEEEQAPALSAEFGARFAAALDHGSAGDVPVTQRARGVELAGIERAFLERLDALRVGVLAEGPAETAASDPAGCSLTTDQITNYLRRKLPDSPGVEATGATALPGGRSKETVLVSLTGTSELPGQVIVRKDRPVGLLQTRAADEYEVIRAVHDFGGVPVPRPFFADEEGQGLGEGTVLVMERVTGHTAGEFFPDLAGPVDHQVELGRHLASSLARLHTLPLDRLGRTHLDTDRATVTEESVRSMVEGMTARIEELTGLPCVSVPLARQWLLDHVADAVPATGPCLLQGDFGFHNMLVDGGRVTALIDWEGAAVGPPSRELGAAYNAVTSLLPWTDFVEAYLDAGGPPEATDPRAVAYYRVFLSLGGFMTSKTGGHLFRTGAKRDLLTAHSGLDSQFRCARNLARALDDAISGPGGGA